MPKNQEIKSGAKELKKSLYEVRNQTPDEQPVTIQEEGLQITEFKPTTYALRKRTALRDTV